MRIPSFRFLSTSALLTVLTLALGGTARAETGASFTPNLSVREGGSGANYGWEFTVGSSNLTVTQLGYFDYTAVNSSASTDLLASSHNVGIFLLGNSTAQMTATVTTSDTFSSGFDYDSTIAGNTTLLAGDTYFVMGTGNNDTDQVLYAQSVTYSPSITELSGAISTASGTVLTYPNLSGNRTAYFGANFQFSSAAAVPEPSSLVLCGLAGVVGTVVAWRKRKRAA